MSTIRYYCGDVRDVMATLPDASVHLVVSSPPFLALRSYLPEGHPDKHREIGSEATPAAFLDTMLGLTADWRRIVAPWGSIAVEIGDTYSGSGGAGGDYSDGGLREGQERFNGAAAKARAHAQKERTRHPERRAPAMGGRASMVPGAPGNHNGGTGWPLAKSLSGIPTLYTWSLAYGRNLLTGAESPAGMWRIRNLLTWTRPNPPVGALGDKFRPATSYVTVACVSDKRWFDLDAVRGPGSPNTHARTAQGVESRPSSGKTADDERRGGNFSTLATLHDTNGAPPLDWWDANDLDDELLAEHWQPLHRLPTSPYKGSHYATFPEALPRRLIEAMCPREVCTVCGEPRRRIVERDEVAMAASARAVVASSGGRAAKAGRATPQETSGFHVDRTINTTVGWTDCGCVPCLCGDRCKAMCSERAYGPGIVLDPFGGSGTTAVAAARAGRDAVLIDLDARNVDLARQRIADQLRIVSERQDGDTTTWTVEAPLPQQTKQVEGQRSIFDEIGATS